MRWLFHAIPTRDWERESEGDGFAPPSLAREGFLHASYRDAVVESARLYLPKDAPITVIRIDPRRLDARVDVATTPRGPMPHVHGAIAKDAIVDALDLDAF